MTDYYADLIDNTTVTGHLVRIDFLSQALPATINPHSNNDFLNSGEVAR